MFAFQFSRTDEQIRDERNQQLPVFRRGLGKRDNSLEKASWNSCEHCLPLTFICASLCHFFRAETENTQTSVGLGRPAVIHHKRQRWLKRDFSLTVSYLHICFLQYSHDSFQTSRSSAPSLPWGKTLSKVLCCQRDIFISFYTINSHSETGKEYKPLWTYVNINCIHIDSPRTAATAPAPLHPKKVKERKENPCDFGSA